MAEDCPEDDCDGTLTEKQVEGPTMNQRGEREMKTVEYLACDECQHVEDPHNELAPSRAERWGDPDER